MLHGAELLDLPLLASGLSAFLHLGMVPFNRTRVEWISESNRLVLLSELHRARHRQEFMLARSRTS